MRDPADVATRAVPWWLPWTLLPLPLLAQPITHVLDVTLFGLSSDFWDGFVIGLCLCGGVVGIALSVALHARGRGAA